MGSEKAELVETERRVVVTRGWGAGEGLPWWLSGKESIHNVGSLGSIPGLGRFPPRRAWQPTPIFLPRESPRTEEPGGL